MMQESRSFAKAVEVSSKELQRLRYSSSKLPFPPHFFSCFLDFFVLIFSFIILGIYQFRALWPSVSNLLPPDRRKLDHIVLLEAYFSQPMLESVHSWNKSAEIWIRRGIFDPVFLSQAYLLLLLVGPRRFALSLKNKKRTINIKSIARQIVTFGIGPRSLVP